MNKLVHKLKQKIKLLKHANEMYEALTQMQAAVYCENIQVNKIPRIAFATQELDAVLKKVNG